MITRDDLSAFQPKAIALCEMCMDEKPGDVSYRDWSHLSFGSFVKPGDRGVYFQLWCDRHDCNVTTIYVATAQWTYNDRVPLRVAGAEQ